MSTDPSSLSDKVSSGHDDLRAYRFARLRYWERRRLIFLGLLVMPAALALFSSEVVSAAVGDMGLDALVMLAYLFIGFAGANACYSVVYIPEFLLMGTHWVRYWNRMRLSVFIVGCMVGILFTFIFCREVIWLLHRSSP